MLLDLVFQMLSSLSPFTPSLAGPPSASICLLNLRHPTLARRSSDLRQIHSSQFRESFMIRQLRCFWPPGRSAVGGMGGRKLACKHRVAGPKPGRSKNADT
ncbi:repressor of lrx1 [Striga asiatica]|uniref:Repressor of lrx1 n=1 Tax=Striga asiatica TaxID=4170 RepID=A0A5A7Q3E6_STRAF|nr:repressor of lrx1 [Striga asiatica]